MHGATLTRFANCASRLFGAMATSGDIDFRAVAWFNGELFDENGILPLHREGIETALKATALDRPEIDLSILGTPIWRCGLDPAIGRQTLPSRDRVLKNSAFDLMTDPGIPLSCNPQRAVIFNDHSKLWNFDAIFSELDPGTQGGGDQG